LNDQDLNPQINKNYGMFYTYFDNNGYQTALALSNDLINWDLDIGTIFYRNDDINSFDHASVTFGCPVYKDESQIYNNMR